MKTTMRCNKIGDRERRLRIRELLQHVPDQIKETDNERETREIVKVSSVCSKRKYAIRM